MRYSEDTLQRWHQPASDSEEIKINNAISMIKDAISRSDELNNLDIEVFVQGSYENNTNVRTSSDVDVCVMLRSTFYTEYPDGLSHADYGFATGTLEYSDYKNRVIRALQAKFGNSNVTVGNKSVKIFSNSYRVDADAVIVFQLKDYRSISSRNPQKYDEGVRFISGSGNTITNYPKIHTQNGVNKNNNTKHEYKKLVRIFKRLRNAMVDDYIIDGDKVSSFLVECLIWNVPDKIISNAATWTEAVRQSIIYLHDEIDDNKHNEWGEVSEKLYLFIDRKWNDTDAKYFLFKAWHYMGYADENN